MHRHIAESMKRKEREEEMLRNFVESTISSLKAHDIGIRNLELKIEKCTNVVKECLKRDTSSHEEPSPEETKSDSCRRNRTQDILRESQNEDRKGATIA